MKRSTFWKVFAHPIWIAALTGMGLFAALLGDGWWDSMAWLGMAIPAALSAKGLMTRRVS